jgi:hypothetical protein
MSCWPNVTSTKCCGDQILSQPNVVLTKCHVDQMSYWLNVLLTKCLIDQMSYWPNVLFTKCLSDQISVFLLHCSNVCRTNGFWPKGTEPIGEKSFKEFSSQKLETLVERMTCFYKFKRSLLKQPSLPNCKNLTSLINLCTTDPYLHFVIKLTYEFISKTQCYKTFWCCDYHPMFIER